MGYFVVLLENKGHFVVLLENKGHFVVLLENKGHCKVTVVKTEKKKNLYFYPY